MSNFIFALLWCGIQVSIFSFFVAVFVLVIRKWQMGLVGEVLFAGLSLIILFNACAMLPVPSWVPQRTAEVVDASEEPETGSDETKQSESKDVRLGSPVTSVAFSEDNQGDAIPLKRFSSPPESADSEVGPPSWAGTLGGWWTRMKATQEPVVVDQAGEPKPGARIFWIGFVLLVGLLIGLGRLLYGAVSLAGLRRRCHEVIDAELWQMVKQISSEIGIAQTIKVYQTDELTTAATIGWRDPIVLLPSNWKQWSHAELSSAISHELVHVAHSDFAKNLVAQIAVSFNIFNPIVHWLGRELRVAQELAADEKAAAISGGRKRYLVTMAELALKQDSNQLGWLAQPFLPTRKTFFRRIEMLKGEHLLNGSQSKTFSWLSRILILAVAVACIGFRVPGINASDNLPEGDSRALVDSSEGIVKENALSYVSDRALFFAAVDFQKLYQTDGMEELVKLITQEDAPSGPRSFFSLGDVRSATAQIHSFDFNDSRKMQGGMVLRRDVPYEAGPVLAEANEVRYRRRVCAQRDGIFFHFTEGNKTLLVASSMDVLKAMIDAGEQGPSVSKWSQQVSEFEQNPIVFAASELGFEMIESQFSADASFWGAGLFQPLWADSQCMISGLDIDQTGIQLNANFEVLDGRDVAGVKNTATAAVTMGTNAVRSMLKLIDASTSNEINDKASAVRMGTIMMELLENTEVTSNDRRIQVKSKVELDQSELTSLIEKSVVASVKTTRLNVSRQASMTNLRQIAIAMHNYADSHRPRGRLPAAIATSDQSDHPHSWRIAILPYLGYQELYDAYRFDEAWDSEHNQKVTKKMPEVYRYPGQPADSVYSGYYLVTGEGTVFVGNRRMGLEEIQDGTSNTILAVESNRKTHWAKPEDIRINSEQLMDQLGGFSGIEFNAAMCDGSVTMISKGMSPGRIKSMILSSDSR